MIRTNLDRTVLKHLNDAAIATLVPADDIRASQLAESSWIRVGLADVGNTFAGHIDGDRADRIERRLTAECYVRMGVAATETTDAAQQLADRVAARLRYLSLPLLDLVTDPTGATTLPGRVRTIRPPQVVSPPTLEGYARRIVDVTLTLITSEA